MIRKKTVPSVLVRANAFNHVDAVFLLLRLRNQIWMIAGSLVMNRLFSLLIKSEGRKLIESRTYHPWVFLSSKFVHASYED